MGKPCSGCCVRQMDCKACARCLPKYLCVDVTVIPGPYTDLECCGIDDYGEGHFSFRLNYSCGGWAGSGTCSGLSVFDLSIALSDDCLRTIVSSSLMSEPELFDGVVPAGMNGVIFTEEGDTLEWKISRANVVENPLATDKCSPCSCARCLPEKLCVDIQVDATDYDDQISESVTLAWDCTTRSWLPEGLLPDGFGITVSLKSAASGICGIDVTVSTGFGETKSTILLEGDLNSRKFHGTICKDSNDIESTEGMPELRPCPPGQECTDPPPQTFVSMIDSSISIMSGSVSVGTVHIKDQSCGGCENCGQMTCCLDPWPTTMMVEWYNDPTSTTAPVPGITPVYWMAGPFSWNGPGATKGYYGKAEHIAVFGFDYFLDIEFVISCDAGNHGFTFEARQVLAGSSQPPYPFAYFNLIATSTYSLDCHPLPDPLPTGPSLPAMICCSPPLAWVPSPVIGFNWVLLSA